MSSSEDDEFSLVELYRNSDSFVIIDIKDETMECKGLSFLVWNVGDQDRTRAPEVYDSIDVGDSDDRRKRLKTV